MKRILRTLTLAALTACLLAVSALADSGPKPLLTVTVEHPPEGVYYLDLLAEGPPYDEGYRTEADSAALDQDLLQAMRDAVPEGWHLCILDGDLIFGDLTGEPQGDAMIHTFSYYGVPDTYRILIAAENGAVWVSDAYTRHALQTSATLDWAAKAVSVPSHNKSGLEGKSFILPYVLDSVAVYPYSAFIICFCLVCIVFILPKASAEYSGLIGVYNSDAYTTELSITAAYYNRGPFGKSRFF